MERMMKYTNPVIKGFYPDPSVCCANMAGYGWTVSGKPSYVSHWRLVLSDGSRGRYGIWTHGDMRKKQICMGAV